MFMYIFSINFDVRGNIEIGLRLEKYFACYRTST